MTDRKMEIFKALVETPVRITPRADVPLIEGTSLHREDVGFILGELQLRHRVDLIPNEPPEAALEETAKKPGKAAAAATIAAPEISRSTSKEGPDLRRRLKELKDEIRTFAKKKR